MQNDEYQQQALRTEYTPNVIRLAHEPDKDFQLARILHGMIGAATEVGELQDAVKKHLIYSKPLDMVNVMEECGDVLWYISLVLHAAGFTIGECMTRNIEKLRARFPEKFTAELANVRDLDTERHALEAKAEAREDWTIDEETRAIATGPMEFDVEMAREQGWSEFQIAQAYRTLRAVTLTHAANHTRGADRVRPAALGQPYKCIIGGHPYTLYARPETTAGELKARALSCVYPSGIAPFELDMLNTDGTPLVLDMKLCDLAIPDHEIVLATRAGSGG